MRRFWRSVSTRSVVDALNLWAAAAGSRRLALAGAILLAGCDPTFLPPDIPSHLGGEGHAEPRKSPFLCRDPSVVIVKGKERAKIGGSPCPTGEVRPDDEHLSCDALYCHGSYEYRADQAQSRHLFGSDGPSCYTCHDEEWKDD